MDTSWSLYLMSGVYIAAGVAHFLFPRIYLRIMPPFIPFPRAAVYLSGILEIVLGAALLIPGSKTIALYGIMALLLLFLPVHAHMLQDKKAASGLPQWVLILRIPLQGLLIYWAYSYL
ncbi:DoxX family protein [Robiginitalea sp. IMCC44478]|uniref:DoxX family protein n=1 Tax=Robiginitalea sp. IMCC44478 TaxID=3459122 RepID=UPI004042C9A2